MKSTIDFLHICKNAISNIDKKYLYYDSINLYSERAFAYEFYHQLRLIPEFDDFDITPEYEKAAKYFRKNKFNLDIKRSLIPDLLIQHIPNKKQNQIAIEIKILNKTSTKAIYGDINKLAAYCHKGGTSLQYSNGVMLVVGEKETFVEQIKRSHKYKSMLITLFKVNSYFPIEIWIVNSEKQILIITQRNIQQILEC